MSRFWLFLALTVAGATGMGASADVWAQAAPEQAATTRLHDSVRGIERRVAQIVVLRTPLARKYEDELKAIDRLKQQRASWRRDRELRSSMAAAKETADRLAIVTRDLDKANAELVAARNSLVLAIEAELRTATDPRAKQLKDLRAQLAPRTHRPAHRITLPDLRIDPLADPEELEQQEALVREAYDALGPQETGLDKQASQADEVARLRKAHNRADAIMSRDDDSPLRTAQRGGNRKGAEADASSSDSAGQAPEGGSAPGGGGGGGAGAGGGLPGPIGTTISDPGPLAPPAVGTQSDASVLADVIDGPTLATLERAQRSSDPAQRAAAARKARDAVKAKRALLLRTLTEIKALKKRAGSTR